MIRRKNNNIFVGRARSKAARAIGISCQSRDDPLTLPASVAWKADQKRFGSMGLVHARKPHIIPLPIAVSQQPPDQCDLLLFVDLDSVQLSSS